MADRVAADLLAKDGAELRASDRLEVANAQQHQALGLRQGFAVGSAEPGRGPDRGGIALLCAKLPAAGGSESTVTLAELTAKQPLRNRD